MSQEAALVETELVRLPEMLEEATEEQGELAIAAAHAQADAKLAYAMAYVQVEGKNADERESQAILKVVAVDGVEMTVSDWQRRRFLAEAIRDSKKEQCYSIRANLGAARSLNANTRAII